MKKEKPIQLGIPPSQRPENRWYNLHGKRRIEIDTLITSLPKERVISYFKLEFKTGGGQNRQHEQYVKTLSNGYMVYVDVAQCKMGILQGFPAGRRIEASNRREFNSAFKKILKIVSI